jgi:hypothetical protein
MNGRHEKKIGGSKETCEKRARFSRSQGTSERYYARALSHWRVQFGHNENILIFFQNNSRVVAAGNRRKMTH